MRELGQLALPFHTFHGTHATYISRLLGIAEFLWETMHNIKT